MSLSGRLSHAAASTRPPESGERVKTQAELDAEYEREDAERLANMSTEARNMCWCSAGQYGGCGLVFTSAAGFDAHRTGPWDARRCLTPDELRAKGYEPNEQGRWRKPDLTGRWSA